MSVSGRPGGDERALVESPAEMTMQPPAPADADDLVLMAGRCLYRDGHPVPMAQLYVFGPGAQQAAKSCQTDAGGWFENAIPRAWLRGDYVQVVIDKDAGTVFAGLVRCALDLVIVVESMAASQPWAGDVVLTGAVPSQWSALVHTADGDSRLLASTDLRSPFQTSHAFLSLQFLLPSGLAHGGPVTFSVVDRGGGGGVIHTRRFDTLGMLRQTLAGGLTCPIDEHSVRVAEVVPGHAAREISWTALDRTPERSGKAAVHSGLARLRIPPGDYLVAGIAEGADGREIRAVCRVERLHEATAIEWAATVTGQESLVVRCLDPEANPPPKIVLQVAYLGAAGEVLDTREFERAPNEAGRFQVGRLGRGRVRVAARAEGLTANAVETALPMAEECELVLGRDPAETTVWFEVRTTIPGVHDTLGAAHIHRRSRGGSWRTVADANGLWSVVGWPPDEQEVAIACGDWRGTATVAAAPPGGQRRVPIELDCHAPILGTLVEIPEGITPARVRVVDQPASPWSESVVASGRFELQAPAGRLVTIQLEDPFGVVLATASVASGAELQWSLAQLRAK